MFVAVLSETTIISVHRSATVQRSPGRSTESTPEPPTRSLSRNSAGAFRSTAPSLACRMTAAWMATLTVLAVRKCSPECQVRVSPVSR